MPDPVILGWQVLDPDGNVVESGEVTVVEVDVLEEIRDYIGDATWPA